MEDEVECIHEVEVERIQEEEVECIHEVEFERIQDCNILK